MCLTQAAAAVAAAAVEAQAAQQHRSVKMLFKRSSHSTRLSRHRCFVSHLTTVSRPPWLLVQLLPWLTCLLLMLLAQLPVAVVVVKAAVVVVVAAAAAAAAEQQEEVARWMPS